MKPAASPPPAAPDSARGPLLLGSVAALACLAFAAFTRHAWEDYYITFRASLNLATGHGLVFQPGERVHTFTSPLGTLLPALFALGGGEDVATRALWLFRLVSAGALGGALFLVARLLRHRAFAPLAIGAAGAAWALDAKTIDFSINGMESALLVFFIVLAWRALSDGARVLPCALALAGLQWTRPDGCVFFGVLGLAWGWLGAAAEPDARKRLGRLVRAVTLGLALYLPWIAFAWWYYGTPVPHTIQAKVSHHGAGELLAALALYPWRLLFGDVALHDVFMPAYFFFGGWPSALRWLARLLALGGALAWLWPQVRTPGRLASLAFCLGGFYVEYIPRSPWYYPGWEALGFIAWAGLLDAALRRGGSASVGAAAARIVSAIWVLAQAALLAAVAWQMRTQQAIIEDGHRAVLGRWLRATAAPGDRVYLEPLGYVGYFSGLKMLDWPGLASPEVVAARRAGHLPHAGIIAALRPEWLVLRPDQVDAIRVAAPRLLTEDYRLARTFDARPALDAVATLPGRGYLRFDAVYQVFQRTGPRPP